MYARYFLCIYQSFSTTSAEEIFFGQTITFPIIDKVLIELPEKIHFKYLL